LNNIAAIAIDRGQYETALRRARNALARVPAMPEALNNEGLALAGLGRNSEAVQSFQRALVSDPRYWPARFNLGRTLTTTGAHSAAAEALELVVAEMPWHAEAHLVLGDLYRGPLDSQQKAQSHYNAFLRRAPSHPRAAAVRAIAQKIAVAPPD
jgi:tetratricopeptide (TPR) repeat protein